MFEAFDLYVFINCLLLLLFSQDAVDNDLSDQEELDFYDDNDDNGDNDDDDDEVDELSLSFNDVKVCVYVVV